MKGAGFSVYDVFAYLVSGSVVLASVDVGFFGGEHIAENPSVIEGALYIWFSYAAGHMVAGLAAWLYERVLVARVLGWPSEALFGHARRGRRIFKEYTAALPAPLRARILERSAEDAGIGCASQALFDYCEASVRAAGSPGERSASFQALSGFARNASGAALVSAAVLVTALALGSLPAQQWGYAVVSFAFALGMCLRYLTLFRRYTREIFVTYATLPSATGLTTNDPA